MPHDPNDPRHRTGFDSYPEDYDSAGNLTKEGREARRYSGGGSGGLPRSIHDTYTGHIGGDLGGRGPASHYHPDGTKKSGLD
jgi:hypothetical protein